MSMGRTLYSLLLYLLAPFAVARLYWKSRELPAYRERIHERFGFVDDQVAGAIWVHAVSVGEAQSVEPLIRALLSRYPDRPVLMTTTTPTGAQRVHSLFGDQVRQLYMPYDLPGVIGRFLRKVQPAMVLVVETEIWPNLIAGCHRRGIPLAMINARMSAPSMKRYRRWVRRLMRRSLQRIDPIAAQSEADRERFETLGA
ncbi:MAG: glycosyltransferase N-terminal domain-containing protein, partial [Gammaproteobacteria bacterium]